MPQKVSLGNFLFFGQTKPNIFCCDSSSISINVCRSVGLSVRNHESKKTRQRENRIILSKGKLFINIDSFRNYFQNQTQLRQHLYMFKCWSVGLSLTSSSESHYQHSFNSMLALQQIIMMHNNSLAMIAAPQVVMSVGGLPKQVTIALHQQNSFIASVCP